MEINEAEFKDLSFCAFRYALGRHTYIVGTIADLLIKHIDHIDEHQAKQMIKEIDQELQHDGGWACDNLEWTKLKSKLENK